MLKGIICGLTDMTERQEKKVMNEEIAQLFSLEPLDIYIYILMLFGYLPQDTGV